MTSRAGKEPTFGGVLELVATVDAAVMGEGGEDGGGGPIPVDVLFPVVSRRPRARAPNPGG